MLIPNNHVVPGPERDRSPTLPAYSLHLDLIRGLSALVVLYGHLHLVVTGHGSIGADGERFALATHPVDGTALPHSAVIVFFVLSGYLVGGSVLRDLRYGRFTFGRYAVRRLSRLWTVLLPALVVGALLDQATQRLFHNTAFYRRCFFTAQLHGWPSFTTFFRYILFLQTIDWAPAHRYGTNGALWSLSSEFWYYVLFPLLALSLMSTRPAVSRAVHGCICAALLIAVGSRITLEFPVWLFGAAVYIVPQAVPPKWQPWVNSGLVVQFLLSLYYFRAHSVNAIVADTVIGFSFTLLLYGLLHRTNRVGETFYSRLAHALSLPSYTLYACHIPMVAFASAFLATAFPDLYRHTALTMAVVCIIVIAYVRILYMLFERNTETIRHWIEGALSGPVERPPAGEIIDNLRRDPYLPRTFFAHRNEARDRATVLDISTPERAKE